MLSYCLVSVLACVSGVGVDVVAFGIAVPAAIAAASSSGVTNEAAVPNLILNPSFPHGYGHEPSLVFFNPSGNCTDSFGSESTRISGAVQ